MTAVAPAPNVYTRGMAAFISGLRYDDIPPEVRHRIKLLILDSLGCGIYAAPLEWNHILQRTLSSVDDTRKCGVWGSAARLSAPHAALVNGTQVQGFELDDVHPRGGLHVGAVVLPAIFALVDNGTQLDGREFLTAAVAGYEMGPRVGMCMGPEHIAQGWHSGATVGVFSSAGGAARALGLTEEQTTDALGIAGTQSCGLLSAQFGAMVKRMHAGRASQSGLYGALLAANGFTGIRNVFESEYGGFCTTFSRSQDRFDLSQLTSGLGERWETMRVCLKFYSCVMSNHTTLDGLRDLQKQHPFGPDDVERITVRGSLVTVEHVGWPYVVNGMTAAQLNLPFCVATLLYDGDVFIDQFTEETIVDPKKIALSRRVVTLEDPEITAGGRDRRHHIYLTVELKDGTKLETYVEAQRGSDRRFGTDEDIMQKFEKLAGYVLPRERVQRILHGVMHLEDLADVRELSALLGQPQAGAP